jgi:hypothetical protein
VNEIGNVLSMPIEDPASNNILHNALEVCNKRYHLENLNFYLSNKFSCTFSENAT